MTLNVSGSDTSVALMLLENVKVVNGRGQKKRFNLRTFSVIACNINQRRTIRTIDIALEFDADLVRRF